MRDALWLMTHQWSRMKIGIVCSILFFAIYGGLTGLFTTEMFHDMKPIRGFMVDMLVITFMSMNGFIFSKGYLNNPYWKTDSFSKQLAMLRSMPIPVDTLAKSRLVQLLVVSPVSTAAFFIPHYFTSEWARGLPIEVYLQLVLVAFAFGNVSSAAFVIIEWSRSGRWYLILSFIAVAMFLIVAIGIKLLTGSHIVFGIGEALQQPQGWLITMIALAAGVIALIRMVTRLRTILSRRDFL